MTKPGGTADPMGFWRCLKCGTPNPDASYLVRCVACGFARPNLAKDFKSRADAPAVVEASKPMPRGGWLLRLSILHLLLVLVVLGTTYFLGGTWWPAALLLLGPRSIWLLPWIPLFAASFRRRRRATWIVQGLALIVFVGPLMGFSFRLFPPWPIQAPDGTGVRLLSFNRGGRPVDAERLIRYIARQKIDVLCFQEPGRDPVLEAFLQDGWHVNGDRLVASRYPIVEEIPPPPEQNADDGRYTMSVRRIKVRRPDGLEFLVASVHMPTLSRGINGGIGVGFRPARFSRHLDWWSKEFGRLIETLGSRSEAPMLVAGDLNMPSDHPMLRGLRRVGAFQFAFEERGIGYGYTKPSSFPWIRIDHILASPEWTVTKCWVGPDFGSDHRSTVAEFSLAPGPVDASHP